MPSPAAFAAAPNGSGGQVSLSGDWTAAALADAGARLKHDFGDTAGVAFDLSGVGRCDTAGALAIVRAAKGRLDLSKLTAREGVVRLITLVASAEAEDADAVQPPRSPRDNALEIVGRAVAGLGDEVWGTLAFIGRLTAAVLRVIAQPRRMRWTACFSQVQRAGLDAIPIIAVTTFFIGAVVGLLGANELAQFGAQVFVVQLIGIAILREFNIIITAVLLAGRSASSFAAEIGAMKMNQEIDAMRVMGVDPFDALVLPRFIALLVTVPVLTFVATIAGLLGGMIVCWTVLGLSPQFFFQRISQTIPVANLWVGLSKGPVMALVIAGIGCRQGLEVGGDVESLGQRVTSAVVQAIFSIIFIDAVFAMIYMELGV